jgi:two-component system nitrate/nitrite response regulator NarL
MHTSARTPVRVVVHARDPLFAETLTVALRQRGHEVEAATADERAATELVSRHHPDVCLLDAGGGAGWRMAACRLRAWAPAVKVVLLSETGSLAAHQAYEDHLVDAVVDEACPFAQLDLALLTTVRGGRYRTSAPPPPQPSSTQPLTLRESQVLEGLVRGAATLGIAEDLGISPFTVRTHVQGVLRKLGVHTRGKAVSVAVAENLLVNPGAEHTS